MITEKEILESRRVIKELIETEKIVSADKKFVSFFMQKAENALETALVLDTLSCNEQIKKEFMLPLGYNGYVWVINAAYYAMFYAATALLAKYNWRIKEEKGIHALTYHALVYYFLDNDQKLKKHYLEQYKEAEKESFEILQVAEAEAKQQIENVRLELEKRREFTYEMGKSAEEAKAQSSIKRAKEFLTIVKELLVKE